MNGPVNASPDHVMPAGPHPGMLPASGCLNATHDGLLAILSLRGHPLDPARVPLVALRLKESPGRSGEAEILAAATAIHNTTVFMARHRSSFPHLTGRWVDDRIEWSLRARLPLAGEGIPLKGDLGIDIPCSDLSHDLLDAMAEADDPQLGREALDAELAAEVEVLLARVRSSVTKLHGLVRDDLLDEKRNLVAYLDALERSLSGRVIYLFPEKSAGNDRYHAGHHVRDILKDARLAARRASMPRRYARADAHAASV